MDVVGFGKTQEEKDQLVILAMLCMSAGIFAADVIIQPGFVIWGLYLVPLLMSIWLAYRYSPFFTAMLISGALLLGGFAGHARLDPSELLDRIVFVLIMAVVAILIWEIRSNQVSLEREIAERRTAQEKLEDLTHTLEIRVADRTRELSEVNELLKNDIIERAKSDRALRAANQKLNILSSVTRHDILNKLMALLTFLDLLKEEAQTNPVILEYTNKELEIAGAIQRQIEFTRDYQDLGVKSPAWEDVAAVIRRAAETLKVGGVALDIAIRGLQVYADPLIEKVFYNLMENSIRHGEHVTTISLWYFDTDSGVVIVYADNGVGIIAQDKDRIFFRGFGKHTGLGMFLCREILSITGLTIHETGEPGRGARFEITVPAEYCRIVPKAG
ncbi:MAG: HAMP domain-containing sensor histidine kinase [Methanoregula sp.]|jgi:signal transduction histidine kinase|nr:HAMP domain-containing sensor histidine kinase [Methanoregula sp.]